MHVLVTCKNEDDQIKNEGARVFTRFLPLKVYGDFSRCPRPLVRCGRISNSSEMLWMFSLPASIKKIRSKMRALECSQHFSHYIPMGVIGCHGHHSSDPIWSKTLCILSPYPMMLQIKFGHDWPTGCGYIQV